MSTGLAFNYYRTVDKSEVDLIIEGFFGEVPIEIKLNSRVNKRSLKSLESFISDMNSSYGLLINRGMVPERLTDKIYQVPVNYI